MGVFLRLMVMACLTIYATSAHSNPLKDKCDNPRASFDVAVELFKSPEFTLFQLEQDYGAKVLVFIGLGNPSAAPFANWFISGRAAEDEEYCYLGLGLGIEQLESPHEANFPDHFGMPGSGFSRCSDSDDPLGGLKVRSWAAKELGKSLILSLSPGDSGEGSFTLLLSAVDTSWVLLKEQPAGEVCYFDRGPVYKSQNFNWSNQ